MDDIELRPLMPEDANGARSVIVGRLGGTRYEARTTELLDVALSFEDPEYMALLAANAVSGQLVGLVIFGAVAGAERVTRIHTVLGDDEGTCAALASAVRTVAADAQERMVIVELPDDIVYQGTIAALRESGFSEEGRIDDFVADGLALRLLVSRTGSPTGSPTR